MKTKIFLVSIIFLIPLSIYAQLPEYRESLWCGFRRVDFKFETYLCTIVFPDKAKKENPWIWNAMFFGHKTNVDSTLLARGYHVVYIGATDLFGSPDATAIWDRYYEFLLKQYKLNRRPALEALSRGGLYAFNWAVLRPANVSCIYADAPVCDIKSWPGGFGTGSGDTTEWKKCLKAYGFRNELDAFNYRNNPIDTYSVLINNSIPVLIVTGDADDIVPAEENGFKLINGIKNSKGKSELIVKPGVAHRHGLKDPTPIVSFIERYTIKQ